MKFTVVAAVLLSTLAISQAFEKTVLIENADDLNKNPDAKGAFCGIVNQCEFVPDISKNSVILSLQNEVDKLKKNNAELLNDLRTLSANTEASKQHNRFADFKSIGDKKPVFWLSGTYFDGLKENVSLSRTGLAPLTDVLGNKVTIVGNVAVAPVRGKMAYIFDKSNSIMSVASVNSKFTFFVVFNFPAIPVGLEGRFFTSPQGNKLFGGWNHGAIKYHNERWVLENEVQTTDKVILALTNDDGVVNIWTHDRQLVVNSNAGDKNWGQMVIGRPQVYGGEAAQVNVYEAFAFDKVLDADQRTSVMTALKRWYDMD